MFESQSEGLGETMLICWIRRGFEQLSSSIA